MRNIEAGVEQPEKESMSFSHHTLDSQSSPTNQIIQGTTSWRRQVELDLASIETGKVPSQLFLQNDGTKLDEPGISPVEIHALKEWKGDKETVVALGEVEAVVLDNFGFSGDPVRKGALSLSQPNDLPTPPASELRSHDIPIHQGVGSLVPILGMIPSGLFRKLGRRGRKLDKATHEETTELAFELPDHIVADGVRFSLMTVMKEVVGAQEKVGLSSDVIEVRTVP